VVTVGVKMPTVTFFVSRQSIKRYCMTMKKLDVIIKNSLLAFIFFSVFNINNCYAGGVLGRFVRGAADDSSVGRVSVGDSYGGGTVFCVSQTQIDVYGLTANCQENEQTNLA
jgi:hypothetical protein